MEPAIANRHRREVAVSLRHAIFAAVSLLALPLSAQAIPTTDAELLALEYSGALLPPASLVAEIQSELDVIDATYPFLRYTLGISARPNWAPGELLLELTPAAMVEMRAGTYTGLDALNAIYGPLTNIHVFQIINWISVEFSLPYQPTLIGDIYLAHPDVLFSEPNYIVGDGSDITYEGGHSYVFKYGTGDCPAGCTSKYYRRIVVTGNSAEIVAEWGDPTDAPPAMPAAYRLEQNSPNPFNPRTRIRFQLMRPGRAQVTLYDTAGRRRAVLLDEWKPGGPHEIRIDAAQLGALASGVYLYTLQVDDGPRLSRRMVLVE
jgi:hypothetical protein